MIIAAYPTEIESQMLDCYNSLSEKDRRRYAAIEATKLGYGGTTYIGSILQCDDRTITRGVNELKSGLSNEGSRIRQSGAGRKLILDHQCSTINCTRGNNLATREFIRHCKDDPIIIAF